LIWYSQEIRPYGLMLAFTTGGLLAFVYALERPTMRRMAIWAVLSGLAFGTQYFAAVIIAPEVVYLIYRYRRTRTVWIGMGILMLFVIAVAHSFLDENSKLPFGYITVFDLGLRIGQVFPQFLIGQGAPLWPLMKFVTFALVLAAIALLYYRGTAREKRAAMRPLIFAAVCFALPVFAAIVGTDRLITRDVLPLWVPAMIFLAACLGVRRAPKLGAAITVALCAIGIFVSLAVVQDTFLQRPDWQAVADTIGTKVPTKDGKQTRRVIMVINNQGVLQMGVFMKNLGAYRGWRQNDVTEVDIVVARSVHVLGAPNCWWGSGCQLGPMSLARAFRKIKDPGHYVMVKTKRGQHVRRIKRVPHYVLTGFHRAGVTRVRQFSIMKFVSATPTTLTKGALRSSIRKMPYIESQLIVQGPNPAPFKLPN
jgi:MFS family permease